MVWGWFKHITISVHFICIFVTLWSNYTAHHYAESVGAMSIFSWAQVVSQVMGSDCKCRWSLAGSPNTHLLLCSLGIEDPCSRGSKSPCCPCFSHRTCFGEWHVSWCDIYYIWEEALTVIAWFGPGSFFLTPALYHQKEVSPEPGTH